MQSPQSLYSDMHVKGGLLRARFLFVVMNHGLEAWARVLATLNEEDRELLKEIVIDDWYALGLLDAVDRAIAAELGGAPDAVYEALGAFSAISSLSGPYSSLLNPDVHSFLRQSALIHHAYQDFGAASYEPLSETSGLLKIDYAQAPPPSFCTSGTAYFRHALELCGAHAAQITHTRCTARGDAACEFYITWQA
jgi:uncharacterized protein (TIGR02265 family)